MSISSGLASPRIVRSNATAWSGLGYYSRARNLQAAARQIVDEHRGRLPDSVDGLRSLKGVGPYTAGAVASIAFDRPAAIVDGLHSHTGWRDDTKRVARVDTEFLAAMQVAVEPVALGLRYVTSEYH